MEGFDTSIETFGRAGVFAHVLDGDTGITDCFGGTSGGEEVDVFGVEEFGEGEEVGFVGDGEEGSGYGDYVGGVACVGIQEVFFS